MKEVTKTDRVKGLLHASLGDPTASVDDFAVFEAVAINTKPLLRRHGLHAGARIGHDVLAAMTKAPTGTRPVPLKLMHRDSLPVGRVFHAEMLPGDQGNTNLNTMFYLPRRESELVGKINANVIGEVSVGIQPASLLCSECGWDYNGADATFDNVWDCVCPNEHKIGTNGTHLKLHGLTDWSELSLVDRGAADGASILSRPKQILGADDKAAMRLRGFDTSVLALFASASDTLPIPKETVSMDYTEKFVSLSAEHAVVGHKLLTAEASVVTLTAELLAAKTALTASQVALTAAQATDAVKTAAELAASNTFLDELVKASFAATGKTDGVVPETVSEKVTLLRDARASLALVIPAGGKAAPAAGGVTEIAAPVSHAAFKRS